MADILKRNVVYSSGIGHADVLLGSQQYNLAVSHRFRGGTELNPCHGQAKYGRLQAQDRDIIIQGDTHRPGMLMYNDGPHTKLAINCGALQTNSGYAKRFFSLYTIPTFPSFALDPHEKQFTPYWSIGDMVRGEK
jgi:hypothetical protein